MRMIPSFRPGEFDVDLDRRTLVQVGALVALVVLVVPFVVFAVPGVVGGKASYVVLSGSMEPAIHVGDVVVVGNRDPAALEVGDVITFDRGTDIPTTHRIVEVIESDTGVAFRTKGDANEDPDPALVAPTQVVGVVVLTIPLIGYVVEFVGTPVGFVALVVVPFGLLAVFELRDALARRRARADATDQTDGDSDGHTDTDSIGDAVESTGSEPAVAVEPGSDGAASGVTVTGPDLTIGIVAFGLFGVYAAYVTYLLEAPWSAVVGAAALGLALLLAAVRFGLFGSPDPTLTADGGVDGTTETERVLTAAVERPTDTPVVTVESPATLRAIAAAEDRWVVRDGDDEYVVGEDVVYTAPVARPTADPDTAAATEAAR
ncbi:MAG: signal peptidase I [Haloarculaceae archaeon]